MASNICEEFSVFCKQAKHLRQILSDTQRCFKDINYAGSLNGSQLVSAEFTESEQEELDNLMKKPPAFVILGQTNQSKAVVVNEILERHVLPVSPSSPVSGPRGGHLGGCQDTGEVRWRALQFMYGESPRVSLCLPNSFELVGHLEANVKPWTTIPLQDLRLRYSDQFCEHDADASGSPGPTEAGGAAPQGEEAVEYPKHETNRGESASRCAVLEIRLNHPLLREGGQILVSGTPDPTNPRASLKDLIQSCTSDLVPVFIYALSQNCLSEMELCILSELKKCLPEIALFFIRVPDTFPSAPDLLASLPQPPVRSRVASTLQETYPASERNDPFGTPGIPYNQRFPPEGDTRILRRSAVCGETRPRPVESHPTGRVQSRKRSAVHGSAPSSLNLFQQLVDSGFLTILPGGVRARHRSYLRDLQSPDADPDNCPDGVLSHSMDSASSYCDIYIAESELVEDTDNLMYVLPRFVHQVLQCQLLKATSLMNLVHTRCLQMFILMVFDMQRDMQMTPKRLEFAKSKESELYESLMDIALKKQDEIRQLIANTISGMRDDLVNKAAGYDFIGVSIPRGGEITSPADLKFCTAQIQDLVIGNLNSAIATKLLGSVDILKDSYTGVLTRCLESLEHSDRECSEAARTSMALREILNSAYQVEITIRAGSSMMKVLLEKMRQLIHSMPWKTPPIIDDDWKRRTASDMLNSLSESRLAKSICTQIKERLKRSHDMFSTALKQLEARHSGRLERTEEQRLKVRKHHAPRVARLALESTSHRDVILYGMPVLGREVGRGQYGVVYSCDAWAGYGPCAIKSVVPPDEKHWNDLAMEFYYTKNVPEHDRVVVLRGSVIDYSYGGGTPAVLLVMDRLQRDLYSAIKGNLDWLGRLQVAIDVVEGIRYLHSQGLVHRDIKLKNVLLDKSNRGKLTDLGFCKPEAMMSGSIVGTPIHMAPELFSGRYDNSVDVYAFGILFWYVCAGHVRLPYAYEQCTNKEMLWTSVRRGVRPEQLTQFDEECWELMQRCWEGEPARRPLLGSVEPQLCSILNRFRKSRKEPGNGSSPKRGKSSTSTGEGASRMERAGPL